MFPAFPRSLLEAPAQDVFSRDLGYMFWVKQVFCPLERFCLVSPDTWGVQTLASHTVQREIPGRKGSMSCIRRPGALSVGGKRKGVSICGHAESSRWVQPQNMTGPVYCHHRTTPPRSGASHPMWERETKISNFKCLSPQTFFFF